MADPSQFLLPRRLSAKSTALVLPQLPRFALTIPTVFLPWRTRLLSERQHWDVKSRVCVVVDDLVRAPLELPISRFPKRPTGHLHVLLQKPANNNKMFTWHEGLVFNVRLFPS